MSNTITIDRGLLDALIGAAIKHRDELYQESNDWIANDHDYLDPSEEQLQARDEYDELDEAIEAGLELLTAAKEGV